VNLVLLFGVVWFPDMPVTFEGTKIVFAQQAWITLGNNWPMKSRTIRRLNSCVLLIPATGYNSRFVLNTITINKISRHLNDNIHKKFLTVNEIMFAHNPHIWCKQSKKFEMPVILDSSLIGS
jgi:hypothetical protein